MFLTHNDISFIVAVDVVLLVWIHFDRSRWSGILQIQVLSSERTKDAEVTTTTNIKIGIQFNSTSRGFIFIIITIIIICIYQHWARWYFKGAG